MTQTKEQIEHEAVKNHLLSAGFKHKKKGKARYYYYKLWKGLEFRATLADDLWHCSLGNNKNGMMLDVVKTLSKMKKTISIYTNIV